MALPKKPNARVNRPELIRAITTPLGFYVLTLLIVEAMLTLVLTCSNFSEDSRWEGFICMFAAFAVFVLVVTVLTVFFPKNLLYGKEEHVKSALSPSALKDQIEDLIVLHVKEECLKPPRK